MSPLRCGLPVNDGVCGGVGFDRSLEMRPLRRGIPVKAQFCVKLSVSRLDLVSLWYQSRRLVWFGPAWFSLDSSSSQICVPTRAQFWTLCCCCCTRAAVGQSAWWLTNAVISGLVWSGPVRLGLVRLGVVRSDLIGSALVWSPEDAYACS